MRALRKSAIWQAVWCCTLLAISSSVIAQSSGPATYFIGSSYSENIANASIEAYDNEGTKCGVFEHGKGNAFQYFGGITFPLKGAWSIEGKIAYKNFSSVLTTAADSTGHMPEIYVNGAYQSVSRERAYDVKLGAIIGSALLSYSLIPKLQLSGGLFLGTYIKHSFAQSEQITGPSNAKYSETSLSRIPIDQSTSLAVPSLTCGAEVGISYELPFQPRLTFRPSIGATIPFNAVAGGKLYIIQPVASLALVYHPSVSVQAPPPQFAWDSLLTTPTPPAAVNEEKKKSVLAVSIKAVGIDQDGNEVAEPTLSIERVHVTEVYPMLHYVFFDDGSAEIPARYHKHSVATRNSFDEKTLYTANALEIHHNVLDILGHRLAESPHASITIVGSRSEHSPVDSLKGTSIAGARAIAVKDYLVSVWGISPSRLHIKARDLPEIASDDHNPFGEAENRRVEILPSSADITAPLWTERIERVATPPRINFEPEITTSAGVDIKSAFITVKQGDRILRQFDASTDTVSSDYSWTLDERTMPDRRDSLTYVFSVVNSLGDTAQASGIIHLRQKTRDITKHETDTTLDKELERYSLILFDYSSSQLDRKESDRIIHDMASTIGLSSTVRLTGHTDQTGDDAFNDRLSRDRVTRAMTMLDAALKQLGKSKPAMSVESRGSRDQLFDNSIPEGRVLSRTVRALIESEKK
jgi:outer membrane protein OmpA-like peptidoglycan-associated protein